MCIMCLILPRSIIDSHFAEKETEAQRDYIICKNAGADNAIIIIIRTYWNLIQSKVAGTMLPCNSFSSF